MEGKASSVASINVVGKRPSAFVRSRKGTLSIAALISNEGDEGAPSLGGPLLPSLCTRGAYEGSGVERHPATTVRTG